MIVIAQFLGLSAFIFLLGYLLSKYADLLAEVKSIDKSIIGLFLLATVTSMPELITSISAVVVVGSPDMAVGNILGSNVINMVIGGLLPLVVIHWTINNLNFYMGFVSITLSLVVGAGLTGLLAVEVLNFNLVSLLLFVLYFVFLFLLKFRRPQPDERSDGDGRKGGAAAGISAARLYIYLTLLSIGVVIVGTLFVKVCDRMVVEFNLSRGFVGVFFMAFATSLPELVVTFTSIKLGSYGMAMGNVLGSNCFNLIIIFIADAVTAAPIRFSELSVRSYVLSIIVTIIIMGLNFKAAIILQGQRRRSFIYAATVLLIYGGYLFILPKH